MKIVRTKPGIEELHRPIYVELRYNEPVEVPDDIGQALVKKDDYEEVKEITELVKEYKSKRKVK